MVKLEENAIDLEQFDASPAFLLPREDLST
jgi:hypothetical protein